METSVNNKCRAFTSLEQSRKLAEILPLESADMYYFLDTTPAGNIYSIVIPRIDFGIRTREPEYSKGDIPCWSLSALLCCLPFPVLYMEMLGGMIFWCCECHFLETDEVVKREHHNNPVDACYEMIVKLNELNLL